MIAALGERGAIGRDGDMPWHIPEDLKFFKRSTLHKPVIMGRKTYESIGKPLPGRANLIVTRNPAWTAQGTHTFTSLEAALKVAKALNPSEIIIGGGAQIYKLALPYADKMYLTRIHETFDGDTFFPDFNAEEWREVSSERQVSKRGLAFSWLTLVRI